MTGGRGHARITFDPPGRVVEAECGDTVLRAALDAGIRIDDECGGRGVCGRCAVRVVEGGLAEPGVLESQRLGRRTGAIRLACQARISGDATLAPLLPLLK